MTYIGVMQAYFFDLDGTLTDSRAGLYPAFRQGLDAIGVHAVTDRQLRSFLGTPLPQVFRAMRPGVSQDEIDRGMMAFRALFERTGVVANELYPGVMELLGSIQKRGSVIWVVTSKPQNQAIEVVNYLKLDRYVAGVIGAGLAETDTKTDLVARALAAAHVESHQALMVGDRSYDIVGAIANGVLPVGALWGYGPENELKAAGCRHFAKSPDDFRVAYVETRAGFAASGLTAAAAGRY
jgi:phosphoglycolate phosphatase